MFSCTSSMPCNLPVRCGFGTVSSWCVSCLSMALFFLECLWSAACKQNNGTSRSCASRFARSTMLRAMFSQYIPMTWPCLNKSVVSSSNWSLSSVHGPECCCDFQITYPTLLKAATGQCAYFHSNSSPAQHSQIGHPLPSPAKQTKTRKKTLLITQPPPAEFFYDDVHPASGPRSSRWGLKCSNLAVRSKMRAIMFRCHISTMPP